MTQYEHHFLDRVIRQSVRASTISFFVVVLSASFGVAMTLGSSFLLLLSSLVFIIRHRVSLNFSRIEWAGLALLAVLVARAAIEVRLDGFIHILNEYRLLWMVPIISVAVAKCFEQREIIGIILVSSLIYIVGSSLMVVFGDPFEIIVYKRDVQHFVGPYLSLGGKFVHGLWAAAVTALGLAIVNKLESNVSRIGVCVAVAYIFGYSLIIEESRTGYVMFAAVGVLIVWKSQLSRLQLSRIGLAVAISVIALSIMESSVRSQLILSINTLSEVMSGRNMDATSIGQRLLAWKALSSLSIQELFLGLGPFEAQIRIDQWIEEGLLLGEPARGKNLHSDIAHLVLSGGLVAVFCYGLFAWAVFRVIKQHPCRPSSPTHGAILGLAIAVFVICFVSGVANSTLLDVRERHVVMVFFVAFVALLRQEIWFSEHV